MLTQGMGALTREIRTAHDARAVALSQLHKATRHQLRQQHDARHALAMRQRADLARSEARRRTGVRAWMQPLTADRVAAHKTWRNRAAALRGRGAPATTATARSPAAGQAAVAGGTGATDMLDPLHRGGEAEHRRRTRQTRPGERGARPARG